MIGTDTWESGFEACIQSLDDPRTTQTEKGNARERLRKMSRLLDRLERDGWDGLDGDIRDLFFPDVY